MEHKKVKTYEHAHEGGTEIKITITAEAKNLNKSDLEKILHKFAVCSRSFYLDFGNEINSKL